MLADIGSTMTNLSRGKFQMAWFMGIDICSRTSKEVITEDGQLVAYYMIPSGANYRAAAEN